MKNIHAVLQQLNQLLSGTNPSVKFLATIVLAGTSYLLITFLGLMLSLPLFSLTWEQLQHGLSENLSNTGTGLLYYLQAIQSIGLFIVPALLGYFILFKKGEGYLVSRNTHIVIASVLIFAVLVFSAPFLHWIIEWNASIRFPAALKGIEITLQSMEEERVLLTERLLAANTVTMYIINIFVISVLPSLGEEFMFRGVFQKIFADWFKNTHLAVIAAAVLFSIFHMQFYGFVPRLILGVYFGYLFVWSRNIWLPVLAHFFNNTIAVSIAFFTHTGDGIQLPGIMKDADSSYKLAVLFSIAATTLLVYYTYRHLRGTNKLH